MMQNVRKRLFSGLMVFMLAICMCCVTVDASESDTNGYKEERGVAIVYSEFYDGTSGHGSAFGIGTIGENTDTFITNKHCVCDHTDNWAPAKDVYLVLDEGLLGSEIDYYVDEEGIQIISAEGFDTSKMVKCDVLYVSEDWDFAIIKAEQTVDRIALELASSAESVSVRTPVYALGFPGTSDQYATSADQYTGATTSDGYPIYQYTYSYNGRVEDVTTTDGIISKFTKLASENDVKVIQHTANINNGNSGGPLITDDGLVLGIDTYGSTDDNMYYAIYIDYVLDYLDQAGIPYNVTYSGGTDNEVSNTEASSSGIPWIPIIVVIAIIVVAVIVVVMVMGRRKPAGATNATRYSRSVNKTNAPGNQSKTTSAKGNSELRFCPYCGAQINGDAKFCGNCGKPLP